MRDDGPLAGRRRSLLGFVVAGRWRAGAGGAPGAVRGGGVSESVAKAPRDRIGREKKRGISTILLRRPGSIRAFATDLDKRRRHGPGRAAASRAEAAAGAPIGRAGPRECLPWSPSGPRRRPPGRPRTPRRALRTRKCSSNRHSRVQNAPLGEEAGRPQPPRTATTTPQSTTTPTSRPPLLARKAQCELSLPKSTSARTM